MKIDLEALFRKPVFATLEAAQLQLFRQFGAAIRGKSMAEIVRLYHQLNQRVNAIKPLTAAQRSAIIEAVRGFLPEGERSKLNGILGKLM